MEIKGWPLQKYGKTFKITKYRKYLNQRSVDWSSQAISNNNLVFSFNSCIFSLRSGADTLVSSIYNNPILTLLITAHIRRYSSPMITLFTSDDQLEQQETNQPSRRIYANQPVNPLCLCPLCQCPNFL